MSANFDKSSRPSEPALPDYTVRVSSRAKRARLQVNLHGRVEVVIPRGFDPRWVPAFVARNDVWLDRALRRVAQYRAAHPEGDGVLPTRIRLPALQQSWAVEYASAARRRVDTLQSEGRLQVSGPDDNGQRSALRRWVHDTARACLVPWLERVSSELDLPVRGVSVRCQKTRWGSCSSRAQISLNRNLLFLPAELVRYLFVHELCHIEHLNHSARFWALVARIEPRYRELERELRAATRYVPLWAYPE